MSLLQLTGQTLTGVAGVISNKRKKRRKRRKAKQKKQEQRDAFRNKLNAGFNTGTQSTASATDYAGPSGKSDSSANLSMSNPMVMYAIIGLLAWKFFGKK